MAYSWAKVYIEVLDDHKMGLLPDSLWRRVIELVLMAKKIDKDGWLPGLMEMSWTLRMPAENLEADLTELAKLGIISKDEKGIKIIYDPLIAKKFVGRDRNDPRYAKWRSSVFERDNYECQKCGDNGYLIAHHVMPWALYPERGFDVSNGLTVCKICHKKIHQHRVRK